MSTHRGTVVFKKYPIKRIVLLAATVLLLFIQGNLDSQVASESSRTMNIDL